MTKEPSQIIHAIFQKIKSIKQNSLGIDLTIEADTIFSDLKIGDSVAINGCCQTVTNISNKNQKIHQMVMSVSDSDNMHWLFANYLRAD